VARYDSAAAYTAGYDDECASCGATVQRGELAWYRGELECVQCEDGRERNAASLDEYDAAGRDCDGIRRGEG
jgi:hypothetical protein